MKQDDLDFLNQHLIDAGRVELRAFYIEGPIVSGLFDCLPSLIHTIRKLRNQASLYATVQAPRLFPTPNKMGGRATRNHDICSFVRIVFDLDCVRNPGKSASDREIEYAYALAEEIWRFLEARDWALPVLIFSGNGCHMIYRIAPVLNTPAFRSTLRQLYTGLAKEFQNPRVKFDVKVRNPGRIMRIPGSLNFKGDTPRECNVTHYPKQWDQLQMQQIEAVTDLLKPKIPTLGRDLEQEFHGCGDYGTLDVVSWFQAHGHYLKHLDDNIHAVRCPWSGEHSTTGNCGDTVIFETDGGWPGFYCHHDHCEGRDIRDVLQIWGDADVFCTREWRTGY